MYNKLLEKVFSSSVNSDFLILIEICRTYYYVKIYDPSTNTYQSLIKIPYYNADFKCIYSREAVYYVNIHTHIRRTDKTL